ncbi:MAG: SWIM zinc finger family protein [Promethearchaeota archaeon]
MVLETLLYHQNSALLASTILLEPELTHNPLFLDVRLADPALAVECFYRLFRIIKIRTGRTPLAGINTIRRYDPIITVRDESVSFETFSFDMTHYSCLVMEPKAFETINNWEEGETNVDFTPEFIKNIRSAGRNQVQGLQLDAESFQVNRETDSVIEKKVELPENWHLALKNIQKYAYPDQAEKPLKNPQSFIQTTPYGPFIKQYAKVELGWQAANNWQFAQMDLRKDMGYVIVGSTTKSSDRLDGRVNPLYQIIRNKRMLRQVKSYLLDATLVSTPNNRKWKVTGSGNTHYVSEIEQGRHECDCKDFQYRGSRCKHIQAVEKPSLTITPLSDCEWKVSENVTNQSSSQSYEVTYTGSKCSCSCVDYAHTQICRHIVKILRHQNDFQFNEFLQDFSSRKSN